jgi:hypothetical protein
VFRIEGFDNDSDELVAQFALSPEVTTEQLKNVFGMLDDDDLLFEWPISIEIAKCLSPHLDQVLLEPEYSWFLSPVTNSD